MSEFSASFHLRSDDVDDAVMLLRRAGVAGFVFDVERGWSAIAHEEAGEAAIIAANADTLLGWSYAADHACVVKAYRGTACVAELAVDFERRKVRFDRDAFVGARLLGKASSRMLERALSGDPRSLRDAVAGAFGLTRFAWLSYRYALEREAFAERRRHVRADGNIGEPEAEPALRASAPPARRRTARSVGQQGLSKDAREGLQALADLDALLRSRDRDPKLR